MSGDPDAGTDGSGSEGALGDAAAGEAGSDAAADASADAADGGDASVRDAGPVDAGGDVDTITAFVEQLNGIWLVGRSGGLNHYSWVRVRRAALGDWSGTAEFLSGDTLTTNAPFWPCSGQGSWTIPAKPYSILFTFPAGCPAGLETEYTFDPISTPASTYPKGAVLQAIVTPLATGPASLDGYKFPDTQCDAAMTSCADPLQ